MIFLAATTALYIAALAVALPVGVILWLGARK